MKNDSIGNKSLLFLNHLSKIWDQVLVTSVDRQSIPLKEALEKCAQWFLRCQEMSRKIIFIGNGGSAAIASHQAIDFWKNAKIKALCFNDSSLITCISNDFGYEQVFSQPLKVFAQEGDIVVAISSSGASKNILNAVDTAQKLGCYIVTFSGFDLKNTLRSRGELNFYVPSHNYGVVEVAHLSLLHSVLEGIVSTMKVY